MTTENTPAERRLLLVQAWSGVFFAAFLLVHLANQAAAALGAERYDALQDGLRRAYQAPGLELLLVLGPLLVHAGAGLMRVVRRARGPKVAAPAWRTRLHRWSGIVLLVFFFGHVVATRGASALYGVFPRFEGVAFTLVWVPAYFWPYYFTFAVAGLYHLVHGLGVGLALLGWRPGAALRRPAVLGAVVGAGALALALGMLGLGGILFDVGRPEGSAYAQLLAKLGFAHLPPVPAPATEAPRAAR